MIETVPTLVAHRGYPHRYPENSMEGILAALKSGACFVEFDIQLSADGVPVVIHDENLLRTAGLDLSVLDTNFSELKAVCIGEESRFADLYSNAFLPSLDEIVDLFADWRYSQAVVEIKRHSLRRFGLDTVLKAVSRALQALRDSSIVISFDYEAISEFRRQGIYQTGWIVDGYTAQHYDLAKTLNPDYLIIKDERIPASVELLWQGEWQWMIYLTNEPRHALSLARLGASLIETNAIGDMLQHPLLKQKACIHE
ncbi:MAG: glycerophosphoryl diester phosphodiesterase [Planctomycetota bacterium]|jgi:glycerophosphoryl diester phosphodiesterase